MKKPLANSKSVVPKRLNTSSMCEALDQSTD